MFAFLKRLIYKPKMDENGERKRKLKWACAMTLRKYHKTFRKLARE